MRRPTLQEPGMSAACTPVHPRQVMAAKMLFTLYDILVLGFSNRFVWECPTRRLLDLYNANISTNHLEAGAGTGYFLDRCRFPGAPARLVLVDRNGYCLAETAYRLRRYRPRAYRRTITGPLSLDGPGFDSVGLNYVLHCLPGTMEEKGAVFENLKRAMNPGAVLFGSTTLYGGIHKNVLARACLGAYNRLGIFFNQSDSLQELQKVLRRHFSYSSIEPVGCSGIFVCRT